VLSNAYKYSPDGGEIEVAHHAGRPLDGRRRWACACRPRHRHDTRAARRVFERFYRADPSGNIPGTGLGMSLVKEITELQAAVSSWRPNGRAPAVRRPAPCTTATTRLGDWCPPCRARRRRWLV
jgi:signal transduction histidine kinase